MKEQTSNKSTILSPSYPKNISKTTFSKTIKPSPSPLHPTYIYTNLTEIKMCTEQFPLRTFHFCSQFSVVWTIILVAVRFLSISLHNTVQDIMRQEKCKQCSQLIVIKFRLPCLLSDKCVEMRWTAQKLTGLSVKKANVGKTSEKYTKTSLLKHKPKKWSPKIHFYPFSPQKKSEQNPLNVISVERSNKTLWPRTIPRKKLKQKNFVKINGCP